MDLLERDNDIEPQVEITLSIEETNKLRAQLGLKPLDLEKSHHEKKAEANYQALMEETKKKKETWALHQRIEKSKVRQKLREKLKGSTLALPDQSIDDPLTWIQRQKQRAQFMETHLNEIDTFVTQPPSLKLEYNEHSLEGLKVGHAMDRFEEGKEFILTLKDQHVLEENDVDELENIDLRGTEKLEAEALAKKGYSPTDEEYLEHEAYDDTSVLLVGHPFSKKPQVLRKYDDPNERLKKSFTVSTPLSRPPVLKKTPTSMSLEKKSGEVSLVMETMKPVQDFYTPEEMVVPTIKTKKRTRPLSMRKKDLTSTTDLPPPGPMTYQESNAIQDLSTMNFVDDEDLQFKLSMTRRQQKQATLPSLSTLLHPIMNESEDEDEDQEDEKNPKRIKRSNLGSSLDNDDETMLSSSGLVFDATSEFAHGITLAHVAQQHLDKEEEEEEEEEDEDDDEEEEEEDADVDVDVEAKDKKKIQRKVSRRSTEVDKHHQDEREEAQGLVRRKSLKTEAKKAKKKGGRPLDPSQEGAHDESIDSMVLNKNIDEENKETHDDSSSKEDEASTLDPIDIEDLEHPLQDEPDLNLGVGAALELFKKRGHLAPPDPDKLAREREYADRLEWGLAHPTSKDKSKSAMKARIKDQVSKFRDYKPGINLDYFDDHGRVLSTKEAYRQLSHRFHGRSSGKNKQEKLMRKEEERRRMLHMAGGDTPLQLASAMLDKQMALGTPGILLSVGSRPASLDSASKK